VFLTSPPPQAILQRRSKKRNLIRRRLLIIVATLAVALIAPAVAGAESVTVTDPSGDAGTAPDIIKLVVADDVAGSFTFRIELATMPDLQPDGFLVVFLDTDRNESTGRNGAEFYVSATPKGVALARWSGSAWEIVADANVQLRLTGSGVQFDLLQTLVGTTRLDAFAGATRESTNVVDAAPDDGMLAFPPRIDRFLIAAAVLSPRAGGVLDARRIETQLTTGEFVKAPLTCRLTYRGRALKPRRGGCSWTIPKALKNKRLTLTINARYRGETVTTTVVVRPR
jgi:hypothetical protein